MLDRANLFIIPLDEERRWYRYHRLFADLLRLRLRQTQPEWEPTLYVRASQWYELNGFFDEAVEHAMRAENFERAAYLIEERADAMWESGEHAKLQRWLADLPVDLIFSRLQLCILHSWYLFSSGQQDAAERYLQAAEQALDSSTDRDTETVPPEQDLSSDADKRHLRGSVAVIRSFMASYLGDVPAIIQYAGQALEYLPEQDLIWRSNAAIALGDAYGFKGDMAAAYKARLEAAEASGAAGNTLFSILAYLKVAITLREQGQLQRTVELCQQQLQLAGRCGLSQGSVAGALLAIWGEVLAELGELERAIDLARKGVELTERGGAAAMLGWSYLCLIRVLFSAGDRAGAKEIVQRAENTARESSLPPWTTNQVLAWRTRLWLAEDEMEAACQWVRQRRLDTAEGPTAPHEFDFFSLDDHLLVARCLIAQERLDEANILLPGLLEAAEAGGRTSRAIEILVLQALAFQAGADTPRAMAVLERALALAEPEGFFCIFVDEGPSMARLLCEAASREIAPDYVHRLLAAFPVAEMGSTGPSKSQAPRI